MKGSELSRYTIKKLRESFNSIYIFNTIVTNKAGVPDICGCKSGKFVAIEIKGKGDRLSEIQKLHQEDIVNSGGLWFLVENKQDVDRVIERLKC